MPLIPIWLLGPPCPMMEVVLHDMARFTLICIHLLSVTPMVKTLHPFTPHLLGFAVRFLSFLHVQTPSCTSPLCSLEYVCISI